ncbi:MAG TPA: enolase C-terminal domain-like protein [Gaiellaceae bacterium]|jgi:L-alanine-DL-glutamate epimerase-like enolase superfamily enzyme
MTGELPGDVVAAFRIGRFEIETSRKLGSSVNPVRRVSHVGVLELETSDGLRGMGVFEASPFPSALPPVEELVRSFAALIAPKLRGVHPHSFVHKIVAPPRGGHLRRLIYTQAVDQAMWDLAAKQLRLPLWRMLGGTDPTVPVYASAHDYSLSTEELVALIGEFRALGLRAVKLKVGFDDAGWERERIQAAWAALHPDLLLLVDANEAWSAKEAIKRMHQFHDDGVCVYWLEDPCLREDYTAIAEIRQGVPFSLVNTGENLDVNQKRMLLERRAVDVLNLHGWYSETLASAQLAAEFGIPVTVGNVLLDIAAPLAPALVGHTMMEYSLTGEDRILEQPYELQAGGLLRLPDTAGHGLELNLAARDQLTETRRL